MPLVVLVAVIGSLVAAVPAAETSAPWRSEKLTLGLVPPVSTASTRLMVRAWGLASQTTWGGIGPGGQSRRQIIRYPEDLSPSVLARNQQPTGSQLLQITAGGLMADPMAVLV
jgi:hypothetical protein